MKKLLIFLNLMLGGLFLASAQTQPPENKKDKMHSCNSNCTIKMHCYQHGEQGHFCSTATKNKKSKRHQCSSDCNTNSHCFKHGEKNHCCCANCQSMQKENKKAEKSYKKFEE